ncbi:MAG: class I SAM-dependent methyltransferase [Actinomycetota bacterium]
MNEDHAKYCSSPEWAEYLQTEVLPRFERDVPLGGDLLEIGPGPGAATEWLRHRVTRLTALEIEEEAAAKLAASYAGTNVQIVAGDATAMEFDDASFDLVGTFTMLHHVPTTARQNQVLAEAFRVLRPGGVLFGSDSLGSDHLHHFHEGDTYNPMEPSTLLTRLQVLGFEKITIGVHDRVTFIAHKPAPEVSP